MNHQRNIQFAVMCLQELDLHTYQAVSSAEISRNQGIPQAECDAVLENLSQAGVVATMGRKQYALQTPVEELKVLDILQAIYADGSSAPAFKLLFATQPQARQKTLETALWSQWMNAYPSENGVQG